MTYTPTYCTHAETEPALTRVVVDHVLQALEGKAGGDVVPAVGHAEDLIVLYVSVPHGQRIDPFRGTHIQVRDFESSH